MRCLRYVEPMEDIPHISRNMVELIDCFVYLISLSPSIRWSMMLWPSACRRRMVSDRWTALDWLASLLSLLSPADDFLRLGHFRSICCGVPQGSVLGPLLFLLYPGELAATCVGILLELSWIPPVSSNYPYVFYLTSTL